MFVNPAKQTAKLVILINAFLVILEKFCFKINVYHLVHLVFLLIFYDFSKNILIHLISVKLVQ